ncbi:MAG: Ni/Fe-hydrogenase, b-type cytochrome subunit [Gemmatimonadota bacterium]
MNAIAQPMAETAGRRVYVWEAPVRLTHWLIVGSMLVLAVTGIFIGTPLSLASGEARDHFIMGTVRVVHFYAAIVFSLAVLSRIVWMFRGNRYARWDQFIPTRRERRRDISGMLRFYLFLDREPPPNLGHNPLAGMAYLAVFGLYLVMILTGLGMYAAYAPVGSSFRAFLFVGPMLGGLQRLHLIHHVAMWLLLGFAAHHIWSAVEVSTVEANNTLESIVTGYKSVPPGGAHDV